MSLSREALLCLCNPLQTLGVCQCPVNLILDLQDDEYLRYAMRLSARSKQNAHLSILYLVV